MRFGAVIHPTVRFGAVLEIVNATVRFGAVFRCHEPYGAVRLYFMSYGAVRFGFEESKKTTARFGNRSEPHRTDMKTAL